MQQAIKIINGRIYDPVQNLHGKTGDILIDNGRIVDKIAADKPCKTIDARGCVVMPGGVEIHSHVASVPINAARIIQSASGYPTVVPTPRIAGQQYSLMGYTTVIEPAVTPQAAAGSHQQLDHLPNLDAGILLLLGNHEAIVQHMAAGNHDAAKAIVRALVHQSRAFGLKAVNPAGVAAWRRDPSRSHVDSLDDTVPGTGLSPRIMIDFLADMADELGMSHPVHLHGPQLGEPGNVQITTDLIRAFKGRSLHLAHLQYYSYGKTSRDGFVSRAEALWNALSDSPQITVDLGMVSFGPAFTATADLPLEHALYRHVAVAGKPACFFETGNEDCFGVMPLVHSPEVPTHAIQWATGLELALLAPDPWRVALTIDHPNGGSFLNYPLLIGLLMSKPMRDEQLKHAHANAIRRTGLSQITREYSLPEIVTITRSGPARSLGLKNKGHLSVGADADVSIYPDTPSDPVAMFTRAKWTIKAGQILVNDGELQAQTPGERLVSQATYDDQGEALLNHWLSGTGACV